MLINDEEILLKLKVHWIVTLKSLGIWLSYFIFGLIKLLEPDWLSLSLNNLASIWPQINVVIPAISKIPNILIIFLSITLIALISALIQISFRTFFIHCLIQLSLTFLFFSQIDLKISFEKILIILGILGFFYRFLKSTHTRYLITNKRIIIKSGLFGGLERAIFYNKIDDLILKRSIFSRFFGYGSIIPITSSQLGLGSQGAGIALGGGLKTGPLASGLASNFNQNKNTIMESEEYCLFCINNPNRAYKTILEQVNLANN